ncbi:hypothetical protein Tco_1217168 [Tanacetum coccineum]
MESNNGAILYESNLFQVMDQRFNTTAGNPVKKILLKLNLSDHRSILTDLKVMVALVISIPSDTSKESVGSHAPRVILFGVIPAIIPIIPEVLVVPADPIVTPEVGTVSVVSPTGVLDLVDYSPFSDSDPSEDSLPLAPDLPLVSPFLCSDDTEADGESEPAEQRPKRVRPIPARRLAWRHVSHHSSDCHSSPDSSSSSTPSYHSLSGHIPPDTTDADSSTPQRFVHRSLARTLRHSEAFRRWRFAPLSTSYPPITSELSLGSSFERSLDSSSPSSRPSHKRCRSPTASVPSPTHVSRSIAPTPADLLPPRKRFKDSYSPEDNGEEHMEVDDEEFEAEASAADTREIVVDLLAIGYSFESFRGEVVLNRITEIETTQRRLETSQMVTSGERASLVERIGSLRLEYLNVQAMLSIERDRVDSIRWHMARSQEEFCQVCRDRDDTRRRLRRLESYVERHLGFRP